MAKVNKVRRKSDSRCHRVTPYPLRSCRSKVLEGGREKKSQITASEKKEWKNASCSVCMEYPHNAALLLCSSYHKGCRPYMCATSHRYSNCLEQYKKAYCKGNSTQSGFPWHETMDDLSLNSGLDFSKEKVEASELLCPLCRGQVKGWTVVEPVRKYLNKKKRTCMQDKCSFVGTYKELRKHVKAEHPWARPREVDPSLAEEWKKLENEREMDDVMSTIRTSMPGSVILGDYVIENPGGFSRNHDVGDYLGDVFFRLEPYIGGHNDSYPEAIFERDYESWDEGDNEIHPSGPVDTSRGIDNYLSRVGRRHNRILMGGSRMRRRHRAANGDP